MADREKVIEGLKKVWNAFNTMEHELYADYVFDALELLKEQEPGWINVKDRLPVELHSIWFPLYDTQKWRDAMWREESDKVIVAVVFPDGTQYVTTGETQDGKWKTTISQTIPYTVTHWMPLPEPPEVT